MVENKPKFICKMHLLSFIHYKLNCIAYKKRKLTIFSLELALVNYVCIWQAP